MSFFGAPVNISVFDDLQTGIEVPGSQRSKS
jgi:hypothetical protein